MISPIDANNALKSTPAKTGESTDRAPSRNLDEAFETLGATLERKIRAAAETERAAAEIRAEFGGAISSAHSLDPDRVAALIADPE